MKNEIAILILAHKNKEQLIRLIEHLKPNFDIYMHLDKKTPFELKSFENVMIYKKYKVYWGSYNQIVATLYLYSEASKKNYKRYILISGQDLPILSNLRIVDFFNNNPFEYITYFKLPKPNWKENGGLDRLRLFWENRYHKKYKIKYINIGAFFRLIRGIQKRFNLYRPLLGKYYGGSNWMALTCECILYILEYIRNNPKYLKRFRYTRCADEIFFQSIIINSEFRTKTLNQSLSFIDWAEKSANPKDLSINDAYNILSSGKLFARKFDDKKDSGIIEYVYSMIKTSNEDKC